MKRISLWALLGFVFLVSACAAPLRSDVTRFNDLTPPKGETFIVIAANPDRDGSLELANYAAVVADELEAQGYRPAAAGDPDLVVQIDFGISEPLEQTTRFRGAPYFGPTYFGRRIGFRSRVRASFFHPYYGYYGGFYGLGSFYRARYAYLYDTGGFSAIVYERVFEMTIQKNDGEFVFEGRAISVGQSNKLPKVMPLMIQALFEDFPGENGSTVEVVVKPE